MFAVPRFRKDVGSCCVAHVRQVGETHMEPNLIEKLAPGWLHLLIHHDFIDGQVKGPARRDGSQGAFEREASLGKFLPSEGHPSSGG